MRHAFDQGGPYEAHLKERGLVRALDRYFRGSTRAGGPQVNHRQPVAPPPRVKHAFDFILFLIPNPARIAADQRAVRSSLGGRRTKAVAEASRREGSTRPT
jgi:hypothetical protein